MRDENKFRSVNRILGDRPRLGPFPADQIFPWSVIAILNVFVFNYMLKTSWLGTLLSIAWGWATWWLVSSNQEFFGKFVAVPRISRGYKRFVRIQDSESAKHLAKANPSQNNYKL